MLPQLRIVTLPLFPLGLPLLRQTLTPDLFAVLQLFRAFDSPVFLEFSFPLVCLIFSSPVEFFHVTFPEISLDHSPGIWN